MIRIACLFVLCVCIFWIVFLVAFVSVFVYCLLIYVIFLCVDAGIFNWNMMDHKWSAYKLFLYFHCQSFIYLKMLRLCE